MPNSGKFNPISLLIFVAVMGGLWWVFIFSQTYLDNLDVADAVATGYNQVRNGEREEQIRAIVLGQCNKPTLGWHWEEDAYGDRKEAPGLGLTDENLTIERDEARQTFRIYIDYTREVLMKPSDKWKVIHFHVERAGALAR